MAKHVIEAEVLKGLIAYLQERPYKEVCDGLSVLKQLPLLPEPPPSETK